MKLPEGFLEQCGEYGLQISNRQLDMLESYAELLVQWNEKVNLTAITAPEEIAVKHFLDSLLLLKAADIKQGAALIDVGTGAGFPSIPCKILRDDIALTMLDSLNKRVLFLDAVCEEIGIKAQTIHARAEEGGRKPELREHFDVASARAVANMRELSEYTLPFVKLGGFFAALKGYEVEDELESAKPAIKLLGGRIEEVKKYILPDNSRRAIVIVRKISQTPTKYPRISAKISKSPL
ncbi:MAG: 16S rRNA (guanine(527)-N(7))-methyltransferase RsmG [Hydrogenoanaerobacterium sp.]